MDLGIACLLSLPPLLLVAIAFVPNAWSNVHARPFRQALTVLAGLQSVVACSVLLAYVTGWVEPIRVLFFRITEQVPLEISLLYDGVTSLMFALVSFIGWVICGYSVRYLDGESTQGRYFRWTAFTLGAVSLMVLSGNFLMFLATWILTSLGLHQLLLHYGHRPAARNAAWTKFVVSRIGDAAFIAAIIIIYDQFRTLDFVALFAAARSIEAVQPSMQVAGILLVASALTKSAQFPFHAWLPQTMETPTPVSALMHAGIVNAGGYLMIRTSPLVALSPWALTVLVLVGGFTACFAAVVMLTQTSVKRSLAYSTIAQMGFMLLQCGLGAYSAAMLHILAHSLYKAYAFLSSGSIVSERAAVVGASWAKVPIPRVKLVVFSMFLFGLLGTSLVAVGIDPRVKSGAILLGGVLCLGLTSWVGQVMRHSSRELSRRAMIMASGLCLVYSVSFLAVDTVIAASLPVFATPQWMMAISAVVFVGFTCVFAIQAVLLTSRPSAILRRLHIHASNGFYLESMTHRLLKPLLAP